MSIKEQFAVIKKNWLLIILGLVILIFLSSENGVVNQNFDSVKSMGRFLEAGYSDTMVDSDMMNYYPGSSDGFAPEVEERKIVKSSSLSTEIERGEFKEAEIQLKNIVRSSGAFLLDERTNRNGEGWKSYYYGYYSLKVDTEKYDAVVAQLKEIGEVQSFNENMADVTGKYEKTEIEIEIERARLLRYMEMYSDAKEIDDRINLNDRIFDQERKIKYLEDSLKNIDSKIDYSSISFSMSEKRSEWINITLVKLSDLIRNFVGSVNNLLTLIFSAVPWVVAFLIGRFFWKKFRK